MSKDFKPDLQNINHQIREQILPRMAQAGDYATQIKSLEIHRRDETNLCENCFYSPRVSIIVQGFKRSLIGTEEYRYGEGHYLMTSIDIPAVNSITVASSEKPFLSVSIALDQPLLTELIAESPSLTKIEAIPFKGISVGNVEPDILNSFLRLVQLLDKPEQISVLSPMMLKEIHYLLLIGPFGQQLRSINTYGSHSNHILNTIHWLKLNYKETVSVEDLAHKANMSLSTFHRHFKAITTLTPLQYQKQLRLHEARRLMLTGKLNASSSGLTVGYESATQFNREYKKLFGNPPHKDIARILS